MPSGPRLKLGSLAAGAACAAGTEVSIDGAMALSSSSRVPGRLLRSSAAGTASAVGAEVSVDFAVVVSSASRMPGRMRGS